MGLSETVDKITTGPAEGIIALSYVYINNKFQEFQFQVLETFTPESGSVRSHKPSDLSRLSLNSSALFPFPTCVPMG